MSSFESHGMRVDDSKVSRQSSFFAEITALIPRGSVDSSDTASSFLPRMEITTGRGVLPAGDSTGNSTARTHTDEKIQTAAAAIDPDCGDKRIKRVSSYQPDYGRKSESAKQWDRDAQKLKDKPVEVNANGKYEVQQGDSVWGIAERVLKQRGEKAGPKEVSAMVAQIEEANRKKGDCDLSYSASGDGPPGGGAVMFLTPGDKVVIPGKAEEPPRAVGTDAPKERETPMSTDVPKERETAKARTDAPKEEPSETSAVWVGDLPPQKPKPNGDDPSVMAVESPRRAETLNVELLEARPKNFAYARRIELPDVLMPTEFKGSGPDNSMVVKTKEGNVTYWADGTVRMTKDDKSGFVYKPDGSGGYSYKHWGADAENYTITYNKEDEAIVETDSKGVKRTIWRDDTVRVENPDNSGYVERHHKEGGVDVHRWEGSKKERRPNERLGR